MPSQPGRRRAVDAVMNLVPFIDLLSCCLSFLLITAVWTQLARIPVAPPAGSTADDPPREPRSGPTLTLLIDDHGFTFLRSDGESQAIPQRDAAYDFGALAELLRRTRAALPDCSDITVRATDGVHYRTLIETMDVVAPSFPEIAVAESS
jgi:biopolymer transport protein TolR